MKATRTAVVSISRVCISPFQLSVSTSAIGLSQTRARALFSPRLNPNLGPSTPGFRSAFIIREASQVGRMLSISSSARGGSSVSADHDDGIGHDIGDGGSGNSKEWTHMERTAGEPRGETLHPAHITTTTPLTHTLRLFRLLVGPTTTTTPTSGSPTNPTETPPHPTPFTFHPGQFLDLHIPPSSSLELPIKPGGFTIVSTPALLPHIELAVQQAPQNPAAVWLWSEKEGVVGRKVGVRVGGRFRWPPVKEGKEDEKEVLENVTDVVIVAGGVGVNPLISILQHLHETDQIGPHFHPSPAESASTTPHPTKKFNIRFLYSYRPAVPTSSPSTSTQNPENKNQEQPEYQTVPFLPTLLKISNAYNRPRPSSSLASKETGIDIKLFLTGTGNGTGNPIKLSNDYPPGTLPFSIHHRRITHDDILNALPGHRMNTSETGENSTTTAPPSSPLSSSSSTTTPSTRTRRVLMYICGPKTFTDGFVERFTGFQYQYGDEEVNVRVLSEKWW